MNRKSKFQILLTRLTVACALMLAGSVWTAQARAQGIPCIEGFAGPYPCQNVDLLGFVPTSALVGGSTGAEIWGWTDPATGREYALQALSDAVAFVDVTEPTAPSFLGYLPAPATNFLWRDIKVYRDHAYVVGDFSPFSAADDNPDAVHGLQIFDLTQLRDATGPLAVFESTAVYTGFDEAHNFAINEQTGYGYAVASDTCGGGLHIVDLEPDPADPQFVGCFDDDTVVDDMVVHDAHCVVYHGPDVEHQGKEICFNANEIELDIVDVTDKLNPVVLSRSVYAGSSYVHQGWLTEDHAYFALGDETDELDSVTALAPHNTHTYLWDMHDLDNPVQLPTYVGPTAAIDHNLYFNGRFLYEANYTAGLRILDAAGIATGDVFEAAYFDTHPSNSETTFAGAWGSYPFFESGVVVISNLEDGVYVVRPHLQPDDAEAGDKATGGGWLADQSGGKINFSFEAEHAEGGPQGHLQLTDKSAGVKIRIDEVSVAASVQGACGGILAGENSFEFRGSGNMNGDAASFRVCVEDNGEPGHSRASATPDRFHLECVTGCDYSTAEQSADDAIDGGNIGVRRGPAPDEDPGRAVTLTLAAADPGGLGTLLQVRAFDDLERPVPGATLSLVQVGGNGLVSTVLTTDAVGTALVTASQGASYQAVAEDAAESNHFHVH